MDEQKSTISCIRDIDTEKVRRQLMLMHERSSIYPAAAVDVCDGLDLLRSATEELCGALALYGPWRPDKPPAQIAAAWERVAEVLNG